MPTRSTILSLLLGLCLSTACKKRAPVTEFSAAGGEDLEAGKKFRELTPNYKELGLVKKGSDARDIHIAILLSCDEASILPESTSTHNSTGTSTAATAHTATSTDTSIAADLPPYKTLCPTNNVLNKSDYGDQAFLQIVEWMSGFRPGMNKKDLLAPPSDSEPVSSLLTLDKISDLTSALRYRKITFSGRGPNLNPIEPQGATAFSRYHVMVYLGFLGKSFNDTMASAIAENDITLINGHFYTGGAVTRNEHVASTMYKASFEQVASRAAEKANRRSYRLVAFNGCYSETLETKLLNAFKDVSAKSETRIDVLGHRGVNNYRYFAQQIAKLFSNLHDGAAWIDILKGFKVTTDQTTTTVSGIIRNMLTTSGVPNTVIPILRNNRELLDKQSKNSILFDENGARLDD